MTITSQMVKELRDKTNAGMMDCKKALTETGGDMEKAVDLLRQKGLAVAAKRAGRETKEGVVDCYIHAGGKLGVMVEVGCETDFVAKTDDFKAFAKNIAMHIAAVNPVSVTRDDVPAALLEREREIYVNQALESGKPQQIVDKIVGVVHEVEIVAGSSGHPVGATAAVECIVAGAAAKRIGSLATDQQIVAFLAE